jgi:hypothetical protein
VRTIVLAGEPLPTRLVKELYALGHVQRVFDCYGPSEGTTYSTWALREANGPATIGRPISNTQTYVVDPGMRLVPIGVVGELLLGGDGLARGYLGRPDLTAEKFVPDPFGAEVGGRLYRTGDLVRYLPGGNLEFLGRRDHQVKVRGFRIELGEIETALGRLPGVKDAVVVVREDHPGEKRLVAYVTGLEAQAVKARELRGQLKGRLPEYMVPAAVVALDALPLNQNGKVDRGALPPPAGSLPVEQALVLPRNDLEETVAAIWQEVLHLDEVGVHDNFFDLGGHSLTLLKVHGKLHSMVKPRELSIVEMFEHPTVASLAERLGGDGLGAAAPEAGDELAERIQDGRRRLRQRRELRSPPSAPPAEAPVPAPAATEPLGDRGSEP